MKKYLPRNIVMPYIFFAAACGHKDLHTTINNYPYDKQVINKLPIYDSLVALLVQHYPTVVQFNYDKNAYRYVPSKDGNDLYKVFPSGAADKINQQLADLGADFIYGFD